MNSQLKNNLHAWNNINVNENILDWILNGVQLTFHEYPARFQIANRIFTAREAAFIDEEIARLINSGAISKCDFKPDCVSPIIVVPKKQNKLRLVVDLRRINDCLICPYFRNEGIEVVSQYIKLHDVMISIDLKNGYHHIPISQNDQTYLGFAWKNIYYVWQVCPFGLSVIGYYFNKCIRSVVEYLRLQDLRIIFFVDDGLLFANTTVVTDHIDTLLTTFQELGFDINFEKSELVPQTLVMRRR